MVLLYLIGYLSLLCVRDIDADTLVIYTNATTMTIDENYISVDLDASLWFQKDNGYPLLQSPALKLYATDYKPSLLRFSGTVSDETCYSMSTQHVHKLQNPKTVSNYNESINNCGVYMNQTEFDLLLQFANSSGFSNGMIFGINSLQRYVNGSWNGSNARTLFDYYYKTYYPYYTINYELGNEPDIYPQKYNYPTPTGAQLYEDFKTLSNVLSEYDSDKTFKLYGIDVTNGAIDLFKDFVSSFNENGVIPNFEAFTFHHYYGGNLSYNDYLSVELMDSLISNAQSFVDIKMNYSNTQNISIHISECGTDWGPDGAVTNNSYYDETYLGNFLWLDTIGIASNVGINRIIRHSIWDTILGFTSQPYGGSITDIVIHSDYYATVLFRKLLGFGVLKVSNNLQLGRSLRVYGYCSKSNEVLLMIINVRNEMADLSVTFSDHDINKVTNREEYHLQSADGMYSLNSEYIMINNQTMPETFNQFPTINPLIVSNNDPIQIEPYSFVYVIFKGVIIDACKTTKIK